MKVRCVIVDDEENQIARLERELKKFDFIEIVNKYTDPRKFIKEYNEIKFDMAFVDVDMPFIKGTDLALSIGKPIVFVTAHRKEFSEELMKVQNQSQNILGFLSKADLSSELENILPNIKEQIKKRSGLVRIHSWGGYLFIDEKEIALITTDPSASDSRDKRLLRTFNNSFEWVIVKTASLEKILEGLDPKIFFKINRNFIVSRHSISSLKNRDEVTISLPAGVTDIKKHQSIADEYYKDFKIWIAE